MDIRSSGLNPQRCVRQLYSSECIDIGQRERGNHLCSELELPHASRWIFDMFMTTETLHQFVNLASNGPIAPNASNWRKQGRHQEPVPFRALDYRSHAMRGVDLPNACLWPGVAGIDVTGV